MPNHKCGRRGIKHVTLCSDPFDAASRVQPLNDEPCVHWSRCGAADQLAPDGTLPSEKVEESADGREQAPPRREHRMDNAASRLPLRQDMDKTPGADVFPS